jgi:multicomponent Na+:H+ antiporter subunit D
VWPAPFGITLVADLLSAIMVVLAGFMGFAVALYSLVSDRRERERFGYYPLLQLLLAGVCGAFLTGDIFNLYVWFEVMLIASFVLLALGGERRAAGGRLKYVALNLIASALFPHRGRAALRPHRHAQHGRPGGQAGAGESRGW